jgi:hypothetical protein
MCHHGDPADHDEIDTARRQRAEMALVIGVEYGLRHRGGSFEALEPSSHLEAARRSD